jgi:hypothetical protein
MGVPRRALPTALGVPTSVDPERGTQAASLLAEPPRNYDVRCPGRGPDVLIELSAGKVRAASWQQALTGQDGLSRGFRFDREA